MRLQIDIFKNYEQSIKEHRLKLEQDTIDFLGLKINNYGKNTRIS